LKNAESLRLQPQPPGSSARPPAQTAAQSNTQLSEHRRPLADEFNSELVEDRSPERVALGAATLAEVLQAFEELSELTRHIFILYRLENMKQKDIAARLRHRPEHG